jgi:ADP-ribosylglycohydrolase
MNHPDAPALAVRREGFLVGAVIGATLAQRTASGDPAAIDDAVVAGPTPLPPPPGQRHAAIALGDGLLEELLSGGVDLRRLASRWLAWWRADGFGADPALVQALEHLERFDAPAPSLDGTGPSALAAALPAALAAASPRSMVAGAFHTARLVDPDPASGLAAVSVVVAASRFLEGGRDLMPDVLALLRSNNAPEALFDRFRAIAADPRSEPPLPRGDDSRASVVAVWALWQAQHRPRGVEALRSMAARGGIAVTAGAVLGALLGARDGIEAWPAEWHDGAGENALRRHELAARLARES